MKAPFTTQGKVYVATFALGFLAELLGEVMLYRTVPEDSANLKARFWARYVMGAAFATIAGATGYVAVEALSGAGWKKIAWGLAFVPTLAIVLAMFTLQGVNTVLDSTSGSNCAKIIERAMLQNKKSTAGASQKKVCEVIQTPPNQEEEEFI